MPVIPCPCGRDVHVAHGPTVDVRCPDCGTTPRVAARARGDIDAWLVYTMLSQGRRTGRRFAARAQGPDRSRRGADG